MKKLSCIAVAALVFGLTGCGQPTDSKGKGLSVTGPGATSITQGKTVEVSVSISRAGMTDPVKLDFKLPDGVHVDSKDTTIPKDVSTLKVTLKADDDAKPTDEKDNASVTAEAGGKKPAPAKFSLKVVKK